MKYYSLNKQSAAVDFREATILGQASDKGLYFPERIQSLSQEFLREFRNWKKVDIALEVIRPYVGETIPEDVLYNICSETVDFEFPLKKINEKIYSLELFHGPTLAFKDVGARFMSRCLGYFSKDFKKEVTVLVATSGDTGGAVANGFLGVEGVNVVILYPSGKVSKVQELQLTALGKNVTALEVEGTFDDCQEMVKQAFLDKLLNERLTLTSANSINVARWLPQQFYYFYALQQWPDSELPVISVPSGNFGNICAGILAMVAGAPIGHFVAACNDNDVFSNYILNKKFVPKAAVSTLSNAMDVGNPSNFVRMLQLFSGNYEDVKSAISPCTVSDADTASVIKSVFERYNYILEPHGAVAYFGLEKYLNEFISRKGIILETAHPVKFDDAIRTVLGNDVVKIPDAIKQLLRQEKKSVVIKPEYKALNDFLLSQ